MQSTDLMVSINQNGANPVHCRTFASSTPPTGRIRHAREFEGRQRWNDRYEQDIRVGAVLDPDLRRLARPVPADLLDRLPPRPRYLRYMIVGDHICLIDRWWTVRDVLHVHVER